MKAISEMNNEELLDGAKGRWGLSKVQVCSAELLSRVAAPSVSRETSATRAYCAHCRNRIYLGEYLGKPTWVHHGSNFIPCYGGLTTNAIPEAEAAPLSGEGGERKSQFEDPREFDAYLSMAEEWEIQLNEIIKLLPESDPSQMHSVAERTKLHIESLRLGIHDPQKETERSPASPSQQNENAQCGETEQRSAGSLAPTPERQKDSSQALTAVAAQGQKDQDDEEIKFVSWQPSCIKCGERVPYDEAIKEGPLLQQSYRHKQCSEAAIRKFEQEQVDAEAGVEQGQKDQPGPAEDAEELNARITREVDTCPLPYEQVIGVLENQAAFMRKARMDEHGGSTEETTLIRLLCEHWPTIECNHETKMDRAICSCSKVDLDWQANVGEAVKSWAEHVLTLRVGGSPARSATFEQAVTDLLDAMETCHVCKGALVLQEHPVHCEDCSGDCENHEGPECTPISVLFNRVRKLLAGPARSVEARTLAQALVDTIRARQIYAPHEEAEIVKAFEEIIRAALPGSLPSEETRPTRALTQFERGLMPVAGREQPPEWASRKYNSATGEFEAAPADVPVPGEPDIEALAREIDDFYFVGTPEEKRLSAIRAILSRRASDLQKGQGNVRGTQEEKK